MSGGTFRCGKCGLKCSTVDLLKKHQLSEHKTWHGVKK